MRNYHAEVEAMDARAKRELGGKWQAPNVSYRYDRSSNEGQRATVRGLVAEMEKSISDLREAVKLRLCEEMRIDPKGVKSLDNVIMLSSYDSVVDMMRELPHVTASLEALRKNIKQIMGEESEVQFSKR